MKKIINQIRTFKNIFIIEEHLELSGLGSQLAQFILKNKIKINNFKIFGLPTLFLSSCGNQMQAREKYGISSKKIFKKIILSSKIK